MKFSILKQDLLPYLTSASRSVGIRSTLPVLDNILISAKENSLKISATNLEIGVIKNVSAQVLEEGALTVPAKTLLEIVSALDPGSVNFESQGDNLTIFSEHFKGSINGISSSEFPAIPLSDDKGISFPKSTIQMCSQILFAAAIDEGRPVLTGILTNISGGKIDFVATDGFRLAHRKVSLDDTTVEFKTLIPKKTFEEIIKIILEEDVDSVNISTSSDQNQAVFSLGSTILSSRLIEGIFPSWEKIIPTQIVSKATLDKDVLIKAVKLAAVFSKSEANIVVLDIKKSGLSLSSSAKELGSQENQIEAEVEGEELKIAFNTRFLLDAVSNIPSSRVAIEFSGALSAALVKGVGEDGLEFIIMPVRLS